MDSTNEIQKIIDKYTGEKDAIMAILQDIQEKFGYVAKEAVTYISRACKINPSRIYGILTFYSQFYLYPRGKNIIKVCSGTACHVKGSARNLTKLEELLHIKEGQTTKDNTYTLETIACMGACGLAPVITVNQNVHGHITSDKIDKIIKK